ncbi:MAG: serine hydrolase domain-containing protein [Woeseiaceae bacterium]|jgi:CubicO group peptidase (beta-lactamase class C family)|nr:serine hydrolase domain-containing protein [Woeseiaceae bacterium]
MEHRFLLLLIGILACAPGSSAEITSRIDSLLASSVDTGRIPGVIAIAATSDRIIYEGAAGFRDVEDNTVMTVDTITRIASMTKAITSVAVMQLVEQGKIGLDSPVGEYLPQLKEVDVLEGFDADNNPILRPAKAAVTVRQLLTHTSGYVYEVWNENAAHYAASGHAADDGFLAAPLAFDPGSKWEYGISTDILGVLVEVISGQSLDDYFREHIFIPLGMSDTHFIVPEDELPRLATAYAKSAQGELTPIPYSRPTGDFFSGGGGLKSTARDYILFLQAVLKGGELNGVRILSAASVQLMSQNQIGDLEAAATMTTWNPRLSNDVDFSPGSVDKFGLGFLINGDPVPGGRPAGSLAWAGLYNSYYWIDTENDICGVVITQILPFYDPDVLALLSEFETAVYAGAGSSNQLRQTR